MREDLAWVAGFFEGEGCFTGDKRLRLDGRLVIYPRACISQKGDNGKLLLEKVKRIIGYGSITHEDRQDMWRYNIPTGKFEDFYLKLKRWLSPRRCNRAEEILRIIGNKK